MDSSSEPLDSLHTFRYSFYRCIGRRADALFELTDALLTVGTAVPSTGPPEPRARPPEGLGQPLRRPEPRADRRRLIARAARPTPFGRRR